MVVRVAGFEEEFLRNGHRGSEGDATKATESTGEDLGNIPAQSADPVRGTASVGVDSENPVLEKACFQGTVGDTHSIPSNAYPVSGASNFEKGENDVTFQNQLANIDSELAKFDVGMGPRNLGVNGPSAIDAPPLTNGPVLNHGLTKTSSQQPANVKNQIEFFDRVQQESSSADPVSCQRTFTARKRKHSESLIENTEDGRRQKKEALESSEPTAEAGHQPRRSQ
nr:hypothetical protein CFP56_77004 [Quercus suber]POE92589.1 hypothetical protein CFP56_75609 [Quercus suber]